MIPNPSKPPDRFQPHLEQAFIFLVFFLIALTNIRWITDYDLWTHLQVGKEIWNTRTLPRSDWMSFSMNGAPWVLHEWLCQILLYGIWCLGGANALILFKTMIVLSAYGLAYFYFSRGGSRLHAGISLILAVMASSFHFYERPHIFTFLFPVIDLVILSEMDKGLKAWKAALWLCLVQVLWVNMHGGWVVGPVLVGLYCAGKFLEDWKQKKSIRAVNPVWIEVPCAVLCANLFNPYGAKLLLLPLDIVNQQVYREMIVEWFSPFAKTVVPGQDFIRNFFIAYSVYLVAALFWERKKLPLSHWFISIAFFALATRSIRMIPVFAFTTLPILLSSGKGVGEKTGGILGNRLPIRAAYGAAIVLSCLLSFLIYSNRYYAWQTVPEKCALGMCPAQFPVGAAEFVRRENVPGNGFNPIGWGGYLMWSLPEKKVLIDGRAEVYGPDFMRSYWHALADPFLWQALLARFNVDYAMIPSGLPIYNRIVPWMQASPEWALVYFDESAMVYVRRKSVPPDWLRRFRIRDGKQDGKEFEPAVSAAPLCAFQVGYPSGLLQVGSGYEMTGDAVRAGEFYARAQKEYPHLSAEIYFNCGRGYLQKGEWDLAIAQFEKALRRKPGMANAHYAAGIAEYQKNNVEEARRRWLKTLEIDPGNVEAKRALSGFKR